MLWGAGQRDPVEKNNKSQWKPYNTFMRETGVTVKLGGAEMVKLVSLKTWNQPSKAIDSAQESVRGDL